MLGLTRLPQLCRGFLMLTSVCHNGRGRSGILAGRSWAFKPPVIGRRSKFGVPRLLAHSRQFGNDWLRLALVGCHLAFENTVANLQEVQFSNCRRLSLKANFSATAFSAENLSEEIPNEDLATFRPPPPAPPDTPDDLLAEVPFHYWYSYADLPDNSSRKKATRQKKLEEPKCSLTIKSRDTSDVCSPQLEEMRKIFVTYSAQPGEPTKESREISHSSSQTEVRRRSLMRESRNHSGLSNQKQEEPRKFVTRELGETAGSSLNSGQRSRSPIREPRVLSGSSLNRGEGVVSTDSTHQSSAWRRREECSETVEIQDTPGIVEGDEVAEFDTVEDLEDGYNAERCSSGKSQEEQQRITSAGTTEETGMEKEAFRLSKKEINLLVDKCNRSNRQINMGWRGWGHNYITLVHSYWKKSEVCKIKCKGAVTLDMDFLCNKLEERTGGRVIHRNLGVVYLYRGRDYDPKFAPKLPVMHQRKKSPAKRLPVPFGLTKDDVNAMRARGKEIPALCKLAKNGVFVTLLDDVRKAFETSDLVRVNCQGFEARNFRALGVKLKKLVPCVLISYEFEHVLMWRWDGYTSPEEAAILAGESFKEDEEDVEPIFSC